MKPDSNGTEGPNLTPLIDIVFILLIFFVVTTTFARDLGIEVERPTAQTGTLQPNATLRVALSAREELTVDARPVSWWRLEDFVRERLSHYAEKSALIVVDQRVSAARLVTLMDTLRRAGASPLALSVEEGP